MTLPLWLSIPFLVWIVIATIKNVLTIWSMFSQDSMSSEVPEIEENDPQLLVPHIRSTQVDPTLARERFVVAQNRQNVERASYRSKRR